MSDFSLTLSAAFQDEQKIINDMAKVQIRSEKITHFRGIIYVRGIFPCYVSPIIDKVFVFSMNADDKTSPHDYCL